MTDQGSSLLRIQASSRLAFGATTVALVALASGGTAVLVSHGSTIQGSPTSLPAGSLLPDAGATDHAPIVVERAPGTATPLDPSEQALRDALGYRSQPGRRTLTVPLVALNPTPAVPAIFGPALPPVDLLPVAAPAGPTLPGVPVPVDVPPVVPPVVVPPVVGPPVVVPPVIGPPVVPPLVTPPAHVPHTPRPTPKPVPSPTVPPVVVPPVPVEDPLISDPSGKGKRNHGHEQNADQPKGGKHEADQPKGGKHAASKGRHAR